METIDGEGNWYKVDIQGRFKGKFIHSHIVYEHCRPIKKQPLSFEEWMEKEHGQVIEKRISEYDQYLKEFKEENK
jgi:hypothetical protein